MDCQPFSEDLIADFPLSDDPTFAIPNHDILNLSLPEGTSFATDVEELFAGYDSTPNPPPFVPKTTTTTSCSSSPQYEYDPASFELKHEADVTPPLYSIVSTPQNSSSQSQEKKYPTFSDDEEEYEEVSSRKGSRKRKLDGELEENPVKLEKVIKRRERNRESAAASRQRKKNHITILEGRVRELKEERVSLTKEISSIEGENKAMKDEINSISSLITTSPLLSGMWNRYNTPTRATPTIQKDLRHSPAVKAAFFLFLVMFCAFNSSMPIESQTKIAQPLLTTYFNFLATDGNLIPQQQLQELLDIWLEDPLGLESHSRSGVGLNSEFDDGFPVFFGGDLPDLSDLLTETQTLLMNSPSGINSLNEVSPSLYDTVYQVVSSSSMSVI